MIAEKIKNATKAKTTLIPFIFICLVMEARTSVAGKRFKHKKTHGKNPWA
jgi:hypothetical protein